MITCTEMSDACDFLEHRKCDGEFICPDQDRTETCACNCHFPGNEHTRSVRKPIRTSSTERES